MTRAAERYRGRPEPLAYADQAPGAATLTLDGKHDDGAGQVLHLLDTLGTASVDFARHGVGGWRL